MATKDGGPAFPHGWQLRHNLAERYVGGMTLRDYFAGQALVGMYSCGGHRDVASGIAQEQQQLEMNLTAAQIGHFAEERIAAMAYATADAMLKARDE